MAKVKSNRDLLPHRDHVLALIEENHWPEETVAREAGLEPVQVRLIVIAWGGNSKPKVKEEAAEEQPEPEPEIEAKFGYKDDGTPRKRPAPSPENLKAMQKARWKKEEGRPVVLKVLSSTKPSEKELEDRDVAWSTEEPA